MKKLLTILLILITSQSFAQEQGVYQKLPIYGAQYKRLKGDSAILIPTFCGVPTLLSTVGNQSAIAYDSCGHKFYVYDPTDSTWIVGNLSGTDSSSYHTIGQASDSSYFTINTPDGRVDTVRFVGESSGGITQSQLDDSTAAIRSNLRPYKVYTALLDNSAGDHTTITATVLENTIGAIVWTRNGIGDWVGTLSGAFTGNFAAFLGSDQIHAVGQAENLIKFDDNTVHFQVRDDDSAGGSIDGSIWSLPIEIRIYP